MSTLSEFQNEFLGKFVFGEVRQKFLGLEVSVLEQPLWDRVSFVGHLNDKVSQLLHVLLLPVAPPHLVVNAVGEILDVFLCVACADNRVGEEKLDLLRVRVDVEGVVRPEPFRDVLRPHFVQVSVSVVVFPLQFGVVRVLFH